MIKAVLRDGDIGWSRLFSYGFSVIAIVVFRSIRGVDTLFSPDLRQENAKVVNGMSRNILSASVSMLLDYGQFAFACHATRRA